MWSESYFLQILKMNLRHQIVGYGYKAVLCNKYLKSTAGLKLFNRVKGNVDEYI